MAPVINTYGTKRKKRRGIPKVIFKDGCDLFEALNIEKIKESKPLLDAKRRKQSKKIVIEQKPAYEGCTSGLLGDTTFDKLLKDGPVNSCSPRFSSFDQSNSSASLTPDVFCRGKKALKAKIENQNARQKKSVRKMTVKGSVSRGKGVLKNKKSAREDSFFDKLLQSESSIIDQKTEEINLFGKENSLHLGTEAVKVEVLTSKRNSALICESTRKILSPISPILPVRCTSTPCSKEVLRPSLSPSMLKPQDLACQLEDDVFATSGGNHVSVDLFSSYENANVQLNEGVCSVDMFSSHDQCVKGVSKTSVDSDSDFSKSGTNDDKQPERVVEPSEKFEDLTSEDSKDLQIVAHDISKSIIICDPSVCHSKSQVESIAYSRSFDKLDNLASHLQECEQLPHGYCFGEEYCGNLHENSSPASSTCSESVVRHCRVQLQRCNLKSSNLNVSGNSKPNSVSCSSSDGTMASNLVKGCRILLHRCDDVCSSSSSQCSALSLANLEESATSALSHASEGIQSSNADESCQEQMDGSYFSPSPEKVGVTEKDELEIIHVNNCKVLLCRCDEVNPSSGVLNYVADGTEHTQLAVSSNNLESYIADRDSLGSIVGRTSQNFRKSITHETVVLKPGKKWRRSLSILSKIRTSSGEAPSNARKSLDSDDNRVKGKRWESSVNSVIRLQPSHVIMEDVEESFSLLQLEESARCSSGSHHLQESVVICESPRRVSSQTSASQIYRRCGQEGPVPFLEYYPQSMKKNCKKIGEGVYGEVFLHSGSANRSSSVIKIIPIEGHMEVNGEPQKTFGEILSEVSVAQELSYLRRGTDNITSSFNEVQAIRCVQGCYPDWLQELWHDYNESKGSENDSPEIFQEDQLFIVLELCNGGKDLESFVFSSADQGLAAFRQIALTLAVGEKALSFEHRDLHWGNVLISSTKDKEIHFTLNGETLSTPSKGIQISVIDFTLSRITDPHTGGPIFYDLAKDQTLFTAQGDYQFDIYRMMREYCGNCWNSFNPKTNIAWLHYLLDKLCTLARYKNRTSKVHHRALDILSELKDSILMFEDTSSFVKCPLFSK